MRHFRSPCTRDMNHDEITGRSMSNHNILVGKYCGVDLGTVIDSIPKIPASSNFPVTFNSRREFSETPRRIRPSSELANALYVSHRLSGNLGLFSSSSRKLTSDSERLAREINSITVMRGYAFPPVYRHFIRLSASFSFWEAEPRADPHLQRASETGHCLRNSVAQIVKLKRTR